MTTSNDGEPGVVEANYGQAKVLACVDEVERPVTFGFDGNYGNATTNQILIETVGQDTIQPGKETTYRFSLRFTASGTPTAQVAADIYQQFAKIYPYKLRWKDRRPIGAIFLCASATHWPTNPQGWLNDSKIDVTTAEGRFELRRRLHQYAENCIGIMKQQNAQGMVVWDLEGAAMPHPHDVFWRPAHFAPQHARDGRHR